MALRPVAALFFVAILGAFATVPAAASSNSSGVHPATASYRPDASIRVVKSHYHYPGQSFSYTAYPSWRGVGTYNATGNGQVAKADWQYGCCDETHTISVSIRNNGSSGDRFVIKATGSGLAGWTISYFKGTANITSAVASGAFKTPLLAPGGQFLMTVKLVGHAAAETLAGSRLVTATSSADSTKKDAVKFRLEEATWCFC